MGVSGFRVALSIGLSEPVKCTFIYQLLARDEGATTLILNFVQSITFRHLKNNERSMHDFYISFIFRIEVISQNPSLSYHNQD